MTYTKEERRAYDTEYRKRPHIKKKLTQERITRMKNPKYREHRNKLQRERYIKNLINQRNRYKHLRIELINILGGRCKCIRSDCWHEGRCKVVFIECIHLDHINGGGTKERKKRGVNQTTVYYLKHPKQAKKKLQPLCVNCNWVKRNREEVKRKYE